MACGCGGVRSGFRSGDRTKNPDSRNRSGYDEPEGAIFSGEMMSTERTSFAPQFEPLLDDQQAAALLGIHPKTLQRLARNGRVPSHRIGRFWRYRASELDAWLRRSPGAAGADKIGVANLPA